MPDAGLPVAAARAPALPWHAHPHAHSRPRRLTLSPAPCSTTPQATLAACNVAATLAGHPVWASQDVLPFVDGPFDQIPKAAPSIVNAKELGLQTAA